MPPVNLANDRLNFYYIPDFMPQFVIQMKGTVSLALGNVDTTDAKELTVHTKFCRHVGLKFIDAGGKVYRKRYIICSVGNPIWTGAQDTVDIGGDQWTVTSRTGEVRGGDP